MAAAEKPEGFPGQRIVALPRTVVGDSLRQPILRNLLPTDVGFFPKAAGHRRHRPDGAGQAILIHCLTGAGWCEAGGQQHTVKSGDLLVIPAALPHAYGADDRTPWSIAWVHAAGESVPDFLRELGTSPQQPVVGVGEDDRVRELFREVLDLLDRGYSRPLLVHASQALGYLLATLARLARLPSPGRPGSRERVAGVLHYLRDHLDQPMRVAELAALAHVSPSHFASLFREHTGYPVVDYLLRLRVHRACQLLDTTDLPVKDIAARVGFADPLYFSRVFKSIHTVSPAHYRREHKG